MKLRTVAVALFALAFSNTANAAISAGTSLETPAELFLVIWDNSGSTQNTYVQDLGVAASSQNFNDPGSISPFTVNASEIGTFFGGETNLRFAVLAGGLSGDFTVADYYFTAATDIDVSTVLPDPANSFNDYQVNIQDLGAFVGAPEHNDGDVSTTNATTATSGNGALSSTGGLTYTGNTKDSVSGETANGGALNETLGFYRVGLDLSVGVGPREAFTGLWALDLANSELTYSPIPLPAGVWLLGSAIIGLVGISRRRRAVNA